MKYKYFTCDVFTETRFGGNPLAVVPQAEGLSDKQMQQIAREFNYSESTFVLPARAGSTRRVRIFTPAREVPFAGHPNVGTAFVLANLGELGEIHTSSTVVFEEKAGLVAISIQEENGVILSCEVTAPQSLAVKETVPVQLLAAALSLNEEDIMTEPHPPQVATVGLPFIMTELRNRGALERAKINISGFEAILSHGVHPSLYLYTRAADNFDIRARMFAPLSGVLEDPATGSAGCVLAGLLAHLDEQRDGRFSWRIAQGVEMGRPSSLLARAEKVNGVVQDIKIGGACVLVSEGFIEVG